MTGIRSAPTDLSADVSLTVSPVHIRPITYRNYEPITVYNSAACLLTRDIHAWRHFPRVQTCRIGIKCYMSREMQTLCGRKLNTTCQRKKCQRKISSRSDGLPAAQAITGPKLPFW